MVRPENLDSLMSRLVLSVRLDPKLGVPRAPGPVGAAVAPRAEARQAAASALAEPARVTWNRTPDGLTKNPGRQAAQAWLVFQPFKQHRKGRPFSFLEPHVASLCESSLARQTTHKRSWEVLLVSQDSQRPISFFLYFQVWVQLVPHPNRTIHKQVLFPPQDLGCLDRTW